MRRRAVETRGGTVGRGRRGRRGGSGSRTTRVGFSTPRRTTTAAILRCPRGSRRRRRRVRRWGIRRRRRLRSRRVRARVDATRRGARDFRRVGFRTARVGERADGERGLVGGDRKRMLADIAPRLRDDRAPTLTVSEMTTRRDGNNAERRCDRGEAARVFYQVLVLKTHGFVEATQRGRVRGYRDFRGAQARRGGGVTRTRSARRRMGNEKEDARRRRRGARRSKRRAERRLASRDVDEM